MYQGMYATKKKPRRRYHRKKPSFMLIALVALLGAVVGTTVAYLFTNTTSLVNTFTPGKVTTKVTEDFDGSVKDNVKVQNTGNINAFIRAAVVVTWRYEDGSIYPDTPEEGTDYTIEWTKDGWEKSGDYYYYTKAVAPDELTGVLFTDCKPEDDKTPDNCHLVVEILASGIQSEPSTTVASVWPVTVNEDGTLSVGGNA